jgi:enterochelin esterase-like enzyme
MKTALIALLSALFLTGCQLLQTKGSGSKLAVLPSGCASAGTVQTLELEATDSGTSYQYGLYLPPCYDPQATGLYPIVYLIPDGFNGPEAWLNIGGAQFADELIFSGEAPPFLIVSSQSPDIGEEKYGKTITDELMPYIESHYPVSPDRRHRSVGGNSLGSTAAYRIGFISPDRFAAIGLFGGGAVSGEEEQIQTWLASLKPENKPRVFLHCGYDETYIVDRTRAMMTLLDQAGIRHTHYFTEGSNNLAFHIQYLPVDFHWLALDW